MIRSTFRVTGIFALLTLCLLVETPPASAQGPTIHATATRLGENAVRIDCRVDAPLWLGGVPDPGGEVIASVRIFALRGDLGIPRFVQNDGDHDLLQSETGSLVWVADWLAPSLVMQFECDLVPGRVVFDYDCTLEYFHHYELGWDRWALLGSQRVQGRLSAEITGAIGTTVTLQEVPLAVRRDSWSALKSLYR